MQTAMAHSSPRSLTGPSVSANIIIGYMYYRMNREQSPGWYFAPTQDDLNLHIFNMFAGTFSLDAAHMLSVANELFLSVGCAFIECLR